MAASITSGQPIGAFAITLQPVEHGYDSRQVVISGSGFQFNGIATYQ